MTARKLIALSSLTVLVSACSLIAEAPVPGLNRLVGEEGMFRDRKGDYLKAETIPRTEIPAGMDSFIIDDLLVIPELPADTEQTAFLDPPRPRPIEGRSDREVVIQRMENRAWIVVDVSPSQVWPRIRDYWRQSKIDVAFENPTAGIMETGWFMLESNPLTQEKFRVSVETGFQDNSAEIRLTQISAPRTAPILGQLQFGATSMDPETEFSILTALSTYLADVADLYQASTVSFLAGNISSEGKASLATTPGGSDLLRLRADYDRSWAAIGRALQRGGAEILSQDVAQGVYEVSYVPGYDPNAEEEDEPGFFKKLVTLNGLFGGGDKLEPVVLRVQLLRTGDAVEVLAAPTTGDSEEGKAAGNNLLQMLRNTIA